MHLSQSEQARTHDKAKQLNIYIKKRGTQRERAHEKKREARKREKESKRDSDLNRKKKVYLIQLYAIRA